MRAMLATLLTPWLDALGKRLAKQLTRTKEERAATMYQLNVCPPWLFVALRTALYEGAAQLTGSPENHVSEIKSVKGGRGGKYIEDVFKIRSPDMLRWLVGDYNGESGSGYLYFRENKTSVALLPPLTFRFRTQRVDSPPNELTVDGYFGVLVNKIGKFAPHFRFTPKLAVSSATRSAWEVMVLSELLDWAGRSKKR
eukprot:5113706-Prymnesium_polylepis.1